MDDTWVNLTAKIDVLLNTKCLLMSRVERLRELADVTALGNRCSCILVHKTASNL